MNDAYSLPFTKKNMSISCMGAAVDAMVDAMEKDLRPTKRSEEVKAFGVLMLDALHLNHAHVCNVRMGIQRGYVKQRLHPSRPS